MIEGMNLARALWSGKPVDWEGRWKVEKGTLAPTPHRKGGPPIWCGGMVPAALARAAKHFDGWFPNGPQPDKWGAMFAEAKALAKKEGRDPAAMAGASYLTVAIDENTERANARIDAFLEGYYGAPAAALRRHHTFYAGSAAGAAEWLRAYDDAGAQHLVLRFAGDHERHLETVTRIRAQLGW
jgi:alkanesulfonate monooxygenase SsuD/methylene tetrahydromethanopterin reductase-like flavin-dependent oxidoreductase (luciferase family)